MLARAGADTLGEERQADAHVLAALALLGLLAPQLVVAGDAHRLVQRPRVVARVVLPAGRCRVRELLGPQQVLEAQLSGVHPELGGQSVDDALDEVHGLGDAERAGVRHTAGRLVGVHAGDLAVRRAVVVRAGEDVEEAGRELGRLRGGVEGAVVGEHVDLDPDDLALASGGDLAVHVVVAGEAGRHEVRGAILHPLHGPLRHDRPDDGQHVTRVDRHLVAETAADVRRDHLDLVLGQPGDEGVDGAVGVRRLARDVRGQLPGDRVHVGHRAARLHRRRMRARVDHVERHRHLGGRECGVRRRLVAGLPVEDVVVGLALEVVADHRCVGVQRLAGVDDRWQRLVLDVDQLERVARRVAVLGDDEGHLLALVAHLVGGQHRLHVGRQRRHPGQLQAVEHRAGDHCLDLRVGLCRRRVDRHDAGVGVRAGEDRPVQHAGQLHVVEVVAAAAQEPGVLLAQHAAEPDRVAGCGDRSFLDCAHDVTSTGVRSAAQRTALMMLW